MIFTSQDMFDFNDSISISLAADDNYAMPLAVTIKSILENSKQKINLFLIDGGISNQKKNKILKSINPEQAKVIWLKQKPEKQSFLKGKGRFGSIVYQRIFLPEWLPQNLSKVIYLDCDLLVLGEINELWSIELEDYYVLAAQDLGIPYVSSPMTSIYEDLDVGKKSMYFNSGVLVINLDKWRSNNTTNQVLNYVESKQYKLRWPDQDALNVLLVNQWKKVDPRWNQMHKVYSYDSWTNINLKVDLSEIISDLIENPLIIHFSSSPKPWEIGCKHPRKSDFFLYLSRTAWSAWQLKLRHAFEKMYFPAKKEIKWFSSRLKNKISKILKMR